MLCGHFIKKYAWFIIQSGCVISFIVQMFLLAHEQIHPSHTETTLQEKILGDIEFPVVFKICITNSFKLEKVEEAGYSSVSQYFKGISKYDSSVYGWGGHRSNGTTGLGVQGRISIPHIF